MKLLAFGITREIIGMSDSSRTLKTSMTVGDLRKELCGEFPKLKELNTLAIAVN